MPLISVMNHVKSFLLVGLVVSAGCVSAQQSKDPWDSLVRALDRTRKVSVEAVVLKKGTQDSNTFRMRLEQNAKGTQRTTVIGPLSHQGIVIVDDGKQLKTYWPDLNKMLVQESIRATKDELMQRLQLAAKNYKFEYLQNTSVAGRNAFVVCAVPKNSQMPKREYTIDEKNYYIYRIETSIKGERTSYLDTVAVKFLSDSEVADLALKPLKAVSVTNSPPSISFFNPDSVTSKVGFKPAIPATLPFGFQIFDKKINGEKLKYAAIMVSDGLSHAVIFQYPSSWEDLDPTAITREAKGVKMQAVGELPPTVLDKILDSFMRKLIEGLFARKGTEITRIAFDDLPDNGIWVVTQEGTNNKPIITILKGGNE